MKKITLLALFVLSCGGVPPAVGEGDPGDETPVEDAGCSVVVVQDAGAQEEDAGLPVDAGQPAVDAGKPDHCRHHCGHCHRHHHHHHCGC